MPSQTILVVDDDLDTLQLLQDALSDANYVVRLAADGTSALNIVRGDSPIDLVLLDLIMPDLNGVDVLHALRQTAATSRLPVILMSALAGTEQQALPLGANDYLAKPFALDALLQKVAYWVNRSASAAKIPHTHGGTVINGFAP